MRAATDLVSNRIELDLSVNRQVGRRSRLGATADEKNALKREFCEGARITSRQYNAILFGLKGKIASVQALHTEHIKDAERRIGRAKKVIAKLESQVKASKAYEAKKPKASQRRLAQAPTPEQVQIEAEAVEKSRTKRRRSLFKIHQKKRRLATLEHRDDSRKRDIEDGTVRMAFGSKNLFRKQFSLIENGYVSSEAWSKTSVGSPGRESLKQQGHEKWLADWKSARNHQFFVMGSGDETAGCQSCVATLGEEDSLSLRLRVPDTVQEHLDCGKYLSFEGVKFAYGHENIVAALDGKVVKTETKTGFKRVGTALSYRFLKDEKIWRVYVSVAVKGEPITTSTMVGAIGVDVNIDHLAVTEVDRFGNKIKSWRLAANTYGKSSDQSEAIFGDLAKEIADLASKVGKPVVHESLDFAKKKSELEGSNPRKARMLSSFGYNAALSMIDTACFKRGVAVMEVNPAYTSLIGATNFSKRLGISTHQSAAMAIARRGLGLPEKPANQPISKDVLKDWTSTKSKTKAPTREFTVSGVGGRHVTLPLPERNRGEHVWKLWSRMKRVVSAAHVAHFRRGERKNAPPPQRQISAAECADPRLSAKFRHASQEHCSPGDLSILTDVPF